MKMEVAIRSDREGKGEKDRSQKPTTPSAAKCRGRILAEDRGTVKPQFSDNGFIKHG